LASKRGKTETRGDAKGEIEKEKEKERERERERGGERWRRKEGERKDVFVAAIVAGACCLIMGSRRRRRNARKTASEREKRGVSEGKRGNGAPAFYRPTIVC